MKSNLKNWESILFRYPYSIIQIDRASAVHRGRVEKIIGVVTIVRSLDCRPKCPFHEINKSKSNRIYEDKTIDLICVASITQYTHVRN